MALNFREANPGLFSEGTYVALGTKGNLREHFCALARQKEERTVLVVVPRFLTSLVKNADAMPLGEQVWGDSQIVIPEEIAGDEFRNIFTDEIVKKVRRDGEGLLPVGEVLANFPVAMLERG